MNVQGNWQPQLGGAPGAAARSDQTVASPAQAVRRRAGQREHSPLVGSGPAVEAARAELLEHLASRSEGARRASLLLAASELADGLGERPRADKLARAALEAEPYDRMALREMRRVHVRDRRFGDACALLERELELPLTNEERALVCSALGQLQLDRLNDVEAADASARHALMAWPDCLPASLLLARVSLRAARTREASEALAHAAERAADAALAAALWLASARLLDAIEAGEEAEGRYAAASQRDPGLLEAELARLRLARARGDDERAAEIVARMNTGAHGGRWANELRRHHARLRGVEVDATDAEGDVLALRHNALATRPTGDRASLQAWAQATGGSERALALLELVQDLARTGEQAEASEALRQASLADESLGLVILAREELSRRFGAAGVSAAPHEQLDETLIAAARLVTSGAPPGAELDLLTGVSGEGPGALTAKTLTLDAAGYAGDEPRVRDALWKQAERLPPKRRAGPLLSLLDILPADADPELHERALRELAQAAPGSSLVNRYLARQARDAEQAALLWLEEARHADGAHAAFAATMAGRSLERADADPIEAYRMALEADPSCLPAAWALELVSRLRADAESLELAHMTLAASGHDARERCGRLVRAALLQAVRDPMQTGVTLAKAAAAASDGVVDDLMIRLSVDAEQADVTTLLRRQAERSTGTFRRATSLRAADHFERLGQPEQAAWLCRRVLDEADGPDQVAELALHAAEADAGEHARWAERLLGAARAAANDRKRAFALYHLARYERDHGNISSAVAALESVVELEPDHLPALRALQRFYAESARVDDLARVLCQMDRCLEDPHDLAAHLRCTVHSLEAFGDEGQQQADQLLCETYRRAQPDAWLSARADAAARRANDLALRRQALEHASAGAASADEAVAYALAACDADDQARAVQLLEQALARAPDHSVGFEALARLHEALGDEQASVEAMERAAESAAHAERANRLWHRAGVLWRESLGDAQRALRAFTEVARNDILYASTFAHLRELLWARNDLPALANVLQARLARGGEAQTLKRLHRELAEVQQRLGERQEAIAHLQAALELAPGDVELLRALVTLYLELERFDGAAETMERLVPHVQPDEQKALLLKVAELYDARLTEPARAESALLRALAFDEQDLVPLYRLAALYEREHEFRKLIPYLQRLLRLTRDEDEEDRRAYMLKLAHALEAIGEPREAERTLELCRRRAPDDLGVVRALGAFHRRHGDQPSLNVHLARASNDFRDAIARHPDDAGAWTGLIEVMRERREDDGARVCASAAWASGVRAPQAGSLLDEQGGAPPLPRALFIDECDEQVAPEQLPPIARELLPQVTPSIDKALPVDLRGIGAERLKSPTPALQAAAQAVREWTGVGELVFYRANHPLCVPVARDPLTILLGSELSEQATALELRFLLTRAAKLALSGLGPLARSTPAQVTSIILALRTVYDPHFECPESQAHTLEDLGRRLRKNLPRQLRKTLGAPLMETLATPGFHPDTLPEAIGRFATRAALVATGSCPGAAAAILRMAPEAHDEIRSLVHFAISEAHLKARKRALEERRG